MLFISLKKKNISTFLNILSFDKSAYKEELQQYNLDQEKHNLSEDRNMH